MPISVNKFAIVAAAVESCTTFTCSIGTTKGRTGMCFSNCTLWNLCYYYFLSSDLL